MPVCPPRSAASPTLGLRRRAAFAALLLVGALLFAIGFPASAPAQSSTPTPSTGAAPQVAVISLDGAIGPASAHHVTRALERAAEQGSVLAVLAMDTPGGLDSSMRQIIKAILASPIPVASYVSPGGARAASAGTYILYASHVASMAPGTNLGAATPVAVGGAPPASPSPASGPDAGGGASASERKQVNDAVAYIRGLAEMRGRNAQWAEQAVREAVSLPASQALELGVIDLVATDLDDLMRQLQGRSVNVLGQQRTLQTAGATFTRHDPDGRARLLAAITNPSVALILMMIGVYGLFFEFSNPGLGVPGVLGGICLLLGLYALQMLPVNYAGVALILLGLGFMAAEAFAPSFGILGIGGAVSFSIGALMLVDSDAPGFGIPIALVATLAVLSAVFIAALTSMALRARHQRIVSGDEALAGSEAEVLEAGPHGAWARFAGERWQVRSDSVLQPGQKVRVLARHGLVLDVSPIPDVPTAQGG